MWRVNNLLKVFTKWGLQVTDVIWNVNQIKMFFKVDLELIF